MEILSQKKSNSFCPQVLLIKDGKFIAGLRHYSKKTVWTTPGGRCDEGETVEETLRREVYEETGIRHFSIDAYVGTFDGAKEGDKVPVFLGTTNEFPKIMEPEKFSEWKYVILEEVVDMLNNKDNSDFIETLKQVL